MDEFLKFEQKSLNRNIPVKGIIELTYRCNFRCVYCYLNEKRESDIELDQDQCRLIFSKLRNAGTLALTFTGGELFLNPDADRILLDARESGFAIRLFTNGSMISSERADLIKRIKPLSVDVSLYGADEETYERVTGNGENLLKTLTGLKRLKSRTVPVNVKIAVNRENYRDLDKLTDIADSFGFKSVVSPLLSPSDCGDMTPCSYMLEDEDLKEYYTVFGKKPVSVQRTPEDMVCTSGRNSFVISPAGDVFPCIQIRQSVGNVHKDDFLNIWLKNPDPFLQKIRALRYRDFSECSACSEAPECFFCPGLALITGGDLTGKDAIACRLTRVMKDAFRKPGE